MKNNFIFKIHDTVFSISFPFLSILCLMFIIDEKGNTLETLLAFLIHEMAHIVAIILCGGRVREFKFSICEMNIKTEKEFLKKYQRICVEFSGALANFLTALITRCNLSFCSINIIIACFQLLPVVSLDGDCILETLGVSDRLRKILSFTTSFVLAIIGFAILLYTKYNFSVLLISMYFMFLTII